MIIFFDIIEKGSTVTDLNIFSQLVLLRTKALLFSRESRHSTKAKEGGRRRSSAIVEDLGSKNSRTSAME